jgi:predicted extracellular nuclease
MNFLKTKSLLLILALPLFLSGEEITLMFWNVENLFHPGIERQNRDEEFTPTGKKRYTQKVYEIKLEQLAAIIKKANPDILGLAEIENRKVLEELITRLPHSKSWAIAHFEGTDPRGIDVAILVKEKKLQLIDSQAHKVTYQTGGRTRDILQADVLIQKDTLSLLAAHFPSRYGGQQKSEPKRLAVAERLGIITQELSAQRNILIMGDFNDTKRNKSLKLLQSKYQLQPLLSYKENGTYFYRGQWQYLDHFFGNMALVKSETLTIKKAGKVLSYPQLFKNDPRSGDKIPYRFYAGNRVQRGYADHLPIVITLISSQK